MNANGRVLPGSWLDRYMELCTDTEVPTLFWKWTGLTLLASALRRHVSMDRGIYRLYPNIYVIFVGPPGSKKSTAGDFGYNNIVRSVEAINGFAGRITSEGILRKLGEVAVNENAPTVLESDQSLFLYASELSTLLSGRTRSRNTFSIIDFLTAVYSSGTFDEGTRTNGFSAYDHICVNFLAATTPEGVNDLFDRVAIEGGFISRTIILYQEAVTNSEPWPTFSENKRLRVQTLITDLRTISQLNGEVRVMEQARTWFTNWYNTVWRTTVPHPDLQQYWVRKFDHLLKISMLLSVAERNDLVVEQKHMEQAASILAEAETWMPVAFNNVDRPRQSRLREQIMTYIREQGGSVARSKLTKRFDHRVSGVKELDEVLSPLIVGGSLLEDKNLSTRITVYSINKDA